jgi:hypothetical protein
MSRWATAGLALLLSTGCDPLVGGACADGYAAKEGQCVPEPDVDPQTGGSGGTDTGGGGEDALGGAGGTGTGGTIHVGGSGGDGGSTSCQDPLIVCNDVCVNTQTHPHHCGACDNMCESLTCVDGACVGETAGHVVVLGMSFMASNPATRRLLGNAVFMPASPHVRMLDYQAYSHPSGVKAIKAILDIEAAARSRTWDTDTATSPSAFAMAVDSDGYDVVFIHDQVLAPGGHGVAFASAASASLAAFGQDGGIVVVLATSTSEMPSLLSESGLLDTAGFVPLTGASIVKNAPTDSLALTVPSPFFAPMETVAIVTTEPASPTLSFVFTDDSAAANPVAIHKAIVP